MSEPIGMSIEVGGNLPDSLVEEFMGKLTDEISESTGPYTEKELRVTAGKKPIKWYGMADYGEVDDLKKFCREHDLSFIHHSEAKYEYDASIDFWVPGMKEIEVLNSTQDGDVMVNATAVRPLCDFLLAYIDNGPKAFPLYINTPGLIKIAEAGLKKPAKALALIRKRIQTLLPVEPMLPPFIITKG
jgi:hypothetical protein